MAQWRLLRGWSDAELAERLAALASNQRNFSLDPSFDAVADRLPHGWGRYRSEAVVGAEPAGPPLDDGPFAIGRQAVAHYMFSDPSIVIAHFDPHTPLLGRRILLEIRVLGVRFLGGAIVADVVDRTEHGGSVFGFRYDSLAGHVEAGFEWFLLAKNHETGRIRFRIQAVWRRGDLPTWWARIGFPVLVRRYQARWHRNAHARMDAILRGLEPPLAQRGRRLEHEGPRVELVRDPASLISWEHDEWRT